MFGIGTPEFVVIALVALVVLGPERIPEVMRKVGQFYRQARQMSDSLTGELRQQWEEGMREVEDVSSTINSAWQDASTDTPMGQPPPPLVQLPPPLEAPPTAAAAGPWTLSAAYRDTAAEVEPRPQTALSSPFVLPRHRPVDGALPAGAASVAGSLPAGTALTEAELAEIDAITAGLAGEPVGERLATPLPPSSPPAPAPPRQDSARSLNGTHAADGLAGHGSAELPRPGAGYLPGAPSSASAR